MSSDGRCAEHEHHHLPRHAPVREIARESVSAEDEIAVRIESRCRHILAQREQRQQARPDRKIHGARRARDRHARAAPEVFAHQRHALQISAAVARRLEADRRGLLRQESRRAHRVVRARPAPAEGIVGKDVEVAAQIRRRDPVARRDGRRRRRGLGGRWRAGERGQGAPRGDRATFHRLQATHLPAAKPTSVPPTTPPMRIGA